MASALAHTRFRPSSIEQGLHTISTSLPEPAFIFGASRIPSALPAAPSFLSNISRGSSTSSIPQSAPAFSLAPSGFHARTPNWDLGRIDGHRHQADRLLPGLSALASIASTKAPQPRMLSTVETNSSSIVNAPIPTPSISGGGSVPPVCQNCQTSTTPLWRRDESGSVLCNACGLFLKLHGRPRPISLKTDVIKSRNRVKTVNQGPRKPVSLPATAQPVAAIEYLSGAHRRVSQMSAGMLDRSRSPISRTHTPGSLHDPNIAPQHMFDGVVSLPDNAFNPALPALSQDLVALNDQPAMALTYEQLVAHNTALRTRVSELEVIQMMYSDNENNLRRERDEAIKGQEDLKRRIEQLEMTATAAAAAAVEAAEAANSLEEADHQHKRPRLSDAAGDSDREREVATSQQHRGGELEE